MRYLLDEHIDPTYRVQLLRAEPNLEVWIIGDPGAPPRHLADHLALGQHIPGILVISPSMTMGELIDELVLIAIASEPDEYRDLLLYLPLT